MEISLKYGKGNVRISSENSIEIDIITPTSEALMPSNKIDIDFLPLETIIQEKSDDISEIKIGIAINDKTRPVPYPDLIPPIINKLINLGIKKSNIAFYVSNGTHVPDINLNYLNLPDYFLKNYIFYQHDCTDQNNLIYLGVTSFGTPIIINRSFYECDLKISVGNIEPHHFAGYSGGVKTVAIGLAGKETISHNHSLLVDPNSVACEYFNNKVRKDIEEIGIIVGVDLALNCILSVDQKTSMIFFDHPKSVMEQAIPIINKFHTVEIESQYDLVIASAGGYPKDINFYQSQKASSNASKLLNIGGSMLIIAECSEGPGSNVYFDYVRTFSNPDDVVQNFEHNDFVIGHHKAYLMAKIQKKYNVHLYSSMSDEIVKLLMMKPVSDISSFLEKQISGLPNKKIAIIPNAVTTIPLPKKGIF
jgi:nickel-dependent lactate racemase